MKGKQLNFILSAGLIIIWGLIIYRIANALQTDPQPLFAGKPLVREAYNDFSAKRDTTALLLNYRDPFSTPANADSIPKNKISKPNLKKPMVKPTKVWNFVQYIGYIQSATTRRLTAVMKINNQEIVLEQGESAMGLKLVRNFRDSVKVLYNGNLKFIKLNAANQ